MKTRIDIFFDNDWAVSEPFDWDLPYPQTGDGIFIEDKMPIKFEFSSEKARENIIGNAFSYKWKDYLIENGEWLIRYFFESK